MAFRNLLQWFGLAQRSPLPAYLHRRERFRWLLQRERIRADRNRSTLCLIALEWDEANWNGRNLERIADRLQSRLRITDDVGLIRPRKLGLLLPETPLEGAEVVLRDVGKLLDGELAPRRDEIFVYPADELPPEVEPPQADGRAQRPLQPQPQLLASLFIEPMPVWKRALDLLVGGAALLLASPLFLLFAAAIKLTSRGPIFFVQQRDGLGGVPFRMMKFRTMEVNAERRRDQLLALNQQDGPAFKVHDDPRITAVGRWLRWSSLDELPQLLNILRGEMSLVGPRPLPVAESAQCKGWQRQRLCVTPGLTCIWQVHGRSRVTFTQWMRMDIEYIRNRSLSNDLKLLALTVPAVVSGKGAY